MLLHALCRCLLALFFGFPLVRSVCQSQCIVVANHNTHMDTLFLLRLFPLGLIGKVKVVAAKDYFSHGPGGRIGRALFDLILLDRHARNAEDAMTPINEALQAGCSIVLFPEGTRGEPGVVQTFKAGIGKLALNHPDVPIQPACIHGVEKTLPRGGLVPVPFAVRIELLQPVYGRDYVQMGHSKGRKALASDLERSIKAALEHGDAPENSHG